MHTHTRSHTHTRARKNIASFDCLLAITMLPALFLVNILVNVSLQCFQYPKSIKLQQNKLLRTKTKNILNTRQYQSCYCHGSSYCRFPNASHEVLHSETRDNCRVLCTKRIRTRLVKKQRRSSAEPSSIITLTKFAICKKIAKIASFEKRGFLKSFL